MLFNIEKINYTQSSLKLFEKSGFDIKKEMEF